MKKIMAILVALLVGMTAVAQNGWVSSYHEPDELKGTEEYFIYLYQDAEYSAFYRSGNDVFCIGVKNGIFDYDSDESVSVLVGFYKDNTLQEKMKVAFDCLSTGTSMGIGFGVGQKIIDWLENGGDIRIIAPRFRRGDMDVTIPHRK